MSLCFEHHDFIDDSDTLFSILVASDISFFSVFVPPWEFTLRACWNLVEISLPSSSWAIITTTVFKRFPHIWRCMYIIWMTWIQWQRLQFLILWTLILLKHSTGIIPVISKAEFLTFGWNKRWLLPVFVFALYRLIGSIFSQVFVFKLRLSTFINCRKFCFWRDRPWMFFQHMDEKFSIISSEG